MTPNQRKMAKLEEQFVISEYSTPDVSEREISKDKNATNVSDLARNKIEDFTFLETMINKSTNSDLRYLKFYES